MEVNQWLYLLWILLGTLWVTVTPFIRKYWRDEITAWDHKYTLIAAISYIAAIMATVLLYAVHPLEVNDPTLVSAAGLVVGLSSKPVLEELLKDVFPGWFD